MARISTVLGLDIGGTYVRAALVSGSEIVAHSISEWPQGLSAREEIEFALQHTLNLLHSVDADLVVTAAGVALAALTDERGIVVQWPNRPDWQGLPFLSLFETQLGMPILVEDDANAAAIGECVFGAGQGYKHVLVIMVGTGIGAGLILNGSLFRGKHGWAGELGHMMVIAEGPVCGCGRKGCLQMLASGRALQRAALEHGLPNSVSASVVTEAAERGETWAKEAIKNSGYWLGLAAANVVNLLDLEAVIIGGGLNKLGPLWWTILEDTLQSHLLNASSYPITVRQAHLPDTAGVLGAAYLASRRSVPNGFPQSVLRK